MKKMLVSAAALAAVAAPLAVAVPAQADTAGCVTRTEFRSITKGMTRDHVANVFDTAGHITFQFDATGLHEQDREYRACTHPSYSTVEVDYEWHNSHWVVTGRFAFWG